MHEAAKMSERDDHGVGAPDAAWSWPARLRSWGNRLSMEMIGATRELFAPLHSTASADDVAVTRDLRYGADDRQRLDVFAPGTSDPASLRPVLLFVHGGGFVGGDKSTPGCPFHDNVGLWAARNGLIGVNMTYRLAPQHTWPAGSDDVALAVRWLRDNIAAYGGDAARLFVMGQSAGAAHAAGFIARERFEESGGWRPSGAILVSGLYDTRTMEKNAFFEAYFGSDPGGYPGASLFDALAGTGVPLMTTVAELDPPDFLQQGLQLADAYLRHHGRLPRFVQHKRHNHLSPVLALGTADDSLSGPLLEFIANPGAR